MEFVQMMLSSLDFVVEPIGSSLKVVGGLQCARLAYAALKKAVAKAMAK